MPYDLSPEWLKRIAGDAAEAKRMVKAWHVHQSQFAYFIQFCYDTTRKKIKALQDHTSLISALCDARLTIDTTDLWTVVDNLFRKELVYKDYRSDNNREANYDNYCKHLIEIHESADSAMMFTFRLIERIARLIDLKAPVWATLPPIHHVPPIIAEKGDGTAPLQLFHRDEKLRDKLEAHLAVLKRRRDRELA